MDDDFEKDEDFPDITAIYDLGNGGLVEDFGFCSPEMTDKIQLAFEKGLKEARRRHKEAGVPMATSLDGKIVYIQPEDIEVD